MRLDVSYTEAFDIACALDPAQEHILQRGDCGIKNFFLSLKKEDLPLYLGFHDKLDEAIYYRLQGLVVDFYFYDECAWACADVEDITGAEIEDHRNDWPQKKLVKFNKKALFKPTRRMFRARSHC